MAKASSPIRLEAELMAKAQVKAALHHRTTAEQIEYWAELGFAVQNMLDPESVLSVKTGLAAIRVEPVQSGPIDADAVFEALDIDRESGALAHQVSQAAVKYQASKHYPGYLEKHENGVVEVGRFLNGEFQAATLTFDGPNADS